MEAQIHRKSARNASLIISRHVRVSFGRYIDYAAEMTAAVTSPSYYQDDQGFFAGQVETFHDGRLRGEGPDRVESGIVDSADEERRNRREEFGRRLRADAVLGDSLPAVFNRTYMRRGGDVRGGEEAWLRRIINLAFDGSLSPEFEEQE